MPSKKKCGYWVYDYQGKDVSEAKATENHKTYGVLYNWETAQNVCPDGYHLPTDDEWKELEMQLGMTQADANKTGWRGTIGDQLKSETGWKDNGNGTNESGFNALPGGNRYYSDGTFGNAGNYGNWWSATQSSGSNAWRRLLYNDDAGVSRGGYYKSGGVSVRCLRD